VNRVDAPGTKNLPGRKSDVQECQWRLKLHSYGLLRSCFLPSPQIHGVRTMGRLRDQQVKDAGREIQAMRKALIEMNVHLHNAISDRSGVSGPAMIRAMVSGQRDPRALAALRDPRIQAREPEIIHSLQGNWKEDVFFELPQAVEAYDFHRPQMAKCDRQLEPYMTALPPWETAPATPQPTTADSRKRRRSSKPKGNQPAFGLAAELERILGVSAQRIDGIDVMTIQTVVAELGTDLRAWKTEAHWTSWLNLAAQRDISGGRVIRHTPEHHNQPRGECLSHRRPIPGTQWELSGGPVPIPAG
jgi:transposase